MKRDIFAYAEMGIDGTIQNPRYALSQEETNELLKHYEERAKETSANNSLLEIITLCYAAGFEAGTRCEQKKHK